MFNNRVTIYYLYNYVYCTYKDSVSSLCPLDGDFVNYLSYTKFNRSRYYLFSM